MGYGLWAMGVRYLAMGYWLFPGAWLFHYSEELLWGHGIANSQ